MAEQELINYAVKDLLNSLEKIRSELDNMKVKLSKIIGEKIILIPPEWERKRLKVWAKIHVNGDIVSNEKWKKIYTEVGYDPRGTGGFFAGDQPSLIRVGDDKVAIAKWAVKEVEKYQEWLENQKLEWDARPHQ